MSTNQKAGNDSTADFQGGAFDIRKIQEHVISEAVKAESNVETAMEIVYGKEQPAQKSSDAKWVETTMQKLEDHFDETTVKKIRMNCQCGYGMEEKVALVKELKKGATCLEEFANCDRGREAGLYCMDGELYLQFFFCPCPMLATVERLKTNTWCQCTTGYSKALFEKAFHCDVDVELLKSIKMGDDVCLMKITLHAPDWSEE